MKKFLSFLLAALLLLSCIPAMAEEFPKLDNGAAWDYIGDWFGVSGMDVMGDPTADYPELKLCLYLNGLGDLYLDGGKKEVVGWYIEEGNVFLARTVDKVPQADEIFAYAYKDDTGRLVVDLMTVSSFTLGLNCLISFGSPSISSTSEIFITPVEIFSEVFDTSIKYSFPFSNI